MGTCTEMTEWWNSGHCHFGVSFSLSSFSNCCHTVCHCDGGGEQWEWDPPPGRAASALWNFFSQESIDHWLLTGERQPSGWQSHELLRVTRTCPNWFCGLRHGCRDPWNRVTLPGSTVPIWWVSLSLGCAWSLPVAHSHALFPLCLKWLRMGDASRPQEGCSEPNRLFRRLRGLTIRILSLEFPLATKCLFIFPLIFIQNF